MARKRGRQSRKANPVALSGMMGAAVGTLGVGETVLFERIRENWTAIAGSAGARNTRPLSLEHGLLTVAVSSPVWMTQARFYKTTFLRNVNSFAGHPGTGVDDIRFTLDRR